VPLKVRDGIPSLRTVKLVRELERSFAASCERKDFRLCHYSFQGNHAHLIVEANSEAALGRGIKAIGSRLAKAVNRILPTFSSTHAGMRQRPAARSRVRSDWILHPLRAGSTAGAGGSIGQVRRRLSEPRSRLREAGC
jgi:hypothetical protein